VSKANKNLSQPTLSIVVPLYNEAAVLEKCYVSLKENLSALNESYEVIYVNDGSNDGSRQILDSLASNDATVIVIHLARNFGQQMATTAGLHHANGRAAIIIDADLQDPPEMMKDFVAKWREGFEVVYGVRKGREGESWHKKLTSFLFYRLMSLISDVHIPKDAGDFRLMDRKAVDAYCKLHEDMRFFRGLVSWVGFRQIGIPFKRKPRAAGVSKYRYAGMIKLAFDTITALSTLPALSITLLSVFCLILGVFSSIVVLVLWLTGVVEVSGWVWGFLGLINLINFQFVSLATFGEYIVRTHRNTQQRPLYLIDSIVEGQKQNETKAA